MSRPPSGAGTRVLRVGIDGRELEGRPTGVGRYLRSLLRRFAESDGHQFVVYGGAPIDLSFESARLETRVIPSGPALLWEQWSLPRTIRRDGIDVLFSPAYSCPLWTSVPRVTAIHDLSFFARPEEFGFSHGLRRRIMARWSARVSRSVLAFSEFTRREIRERLGKAAAAKTLVIPHGPDDDLPPGPPRPASREALGLGDDVTYIITVGTVLRRRNVSTLVRAMAALRQEGREIRLGIVGENRSQPFEDLASLAKSLGCESAIRLSGFVSEEEIARHYAAADIAVFLSEYEGFGLPVLEAMSRGVPTMIANRESLHEMFAPGALVVEPREDEVRNALRHLADDEEAKADLRRRGFERAKAFSWDRAARDTLRALEDAAS